MSEDVEVKDVEQKPAQAKQSVELEARDIKWREQHKALAAEHENLKLKAENEKKELLQKTANLESQSQTLAQKFIEAELKAEAVAAGLTDVDLIKLMDKSTIKLTEDGKIEGISKVVADFKALKPLYFSEPKKSSSSTNATVPENEKKSPVNVLNMTSDEYKSYKESKGFGTGILR